MAANGSLVGCRPSMSGGMKPGVGLIRSLHALPSQNRCLEAGSSGSWYQPRGGIDIDPTSPLYSTSAHITHMGTGLPGEGRAEGASIRERAVLGFRWEASSVDDASGSARTWVWVAVALTWFVVSECIRILFPLLYHVRETTGAAVTVVIALIVFLAPALAGPLARSIGLPRAFLSSVIVLAIGRVAMGLVHPIPLWVAGVATAFGLVAITLEISAGWMRGVPFVAAVFVGLSADAAVRGAFQTWDAAWHTGVLSAAVGIATGAALLASASVAGRLGRERVRTSGSGVTAIGPFLLLELVFLQNPAFAASASGLAMPVAVALVLFGDVVAIAAIASARGSGVERAVASIFVVGGTAVLATAGGTASGIALPVTQVAAATLLTYASTRGGGGANRTIGRSGLAAALGLALFVGLAFAYQIQIDVPLPIPRPAWPLAGAVLLALAAMHAPEADRGRVPWLANIVPLVGLVIVPGALALSGGLAPQAPAAGRGPVILLDWNVHSAVNADGQIDPEAIASVIEARHADIVVLQEVGRGWPIGGELDLAQWLSRRLGMSYAWSPAADDQFGNLVLSHLPIEDVSAADLPYGEGPQHRSYVRVVLEVSPGRTLTVFGTHLQDGDRPATNAAQIRTLLRAWGREPATIIAGDLNVQPTEPNASLFAAAGLLSAQDVAGRSGESTAREPNFPGDRVDWIFASSDVSYSGFEIGRSAASDHLPLVVEVAIG